MRDFFILGNGKSVKNNEKRRPLSILAFFSYGCVDLIYEFKDLTNSNTSCFIRSIRKIHKFVDNCR